MGAVRQGNDKTDDVSNFPEQAGLHCVFFASTAQKLIQAPLAVKKNIQTYKYYNNYNISQFLNRCGIGQW
jgi:hypothetical protein